MPDRLSSPDRLTLVAIAAQTGMHLSTLKRYADIEASREIFGAEGKPPTYPESSLPYFERLRDLHDAGSVTPRTLAALGNLIIGSSESGLQISLRSSSKDLNPVSGLTSLSPEQFEQILTRSFAAALHANRQHHQETAAVPTDATLTTQQAAALLSCHPSSVSRFVTPTRRGRYSAIMVQAELTRQREAAQAKQIARQPSLSRVRDTPALPSAPDAETD